MQYSRHQLAGALALFSAIGAQASPIPKDSDVLWSLNPANVLRRHLHKRANTSVGCGLWSTGNWADIGDGLGEDADEVFIAAQSCGRIGCYDTSGVYVCNDQDADITIPMQEAIDQVDFLKSMCHSSGQGEGYYYVSGQVFSDNFGGYNLNIGYCNNNHPNNAKPSDYAFPGPNGNPEITCGGNSGVPCEGATCQEGSIVVEDQHTHGCQDWLAGYSPAGVSATYSSTRVVGETWTHGGWLGIDTSDLFAVSVTSGYTFSYGKTTTTGDASGITAECGSDESGSFTCAMLISPTCVTTEGYCETDKLGRVPYANVAPQLTGENGQSVYFPKLCVCPNCPDSDNPDAPELTCPMDCATCDPFEPGAQ